MVYEVIYSDDRKDQVKRKYDLVTATLTVTEMIDGNPTKKRMVQRERTFFNRLYGQAHKAQLRFGANERLKEWRKLSLKEQLEYLDRNFPNGAKKQRARIAAKLAAKVQVASKADAEGRTESHKHHKHHRNDRQAKQNNQAA